jgi:hypothetical protein
MMDRSGREIYVFMIASGKRRGGPTLRSEGEYGRESITILLIALTLDAADLPHP